MSSDNAISVDFLLLHAEVGAPVRNKLVVLDEAALVEEEVDALPRRQLVVRMLLVDASLAAALECLSLDLVESLSECFLLILQTHGRAKVTAGRHGGEV